MARFLKRADGSVVVREHNWVGRSIGGLGAVILGVLSCRALRLAMWQGDDFWTGEVLGPLAGTLLLGALAVLPDRSTFILDRVRRQVVWNRWTPWRQYSGAIPFEDIVGIRLVGFGGMGSDISAQVNFQTRTAMVPLSNAFKGVRVQQLLAERLREILIEMGCLEPGASLVSVGANPATVYDVVLERQVHGGSLAEAEHRLRADERHANSGPLAPRNTEIDEKIRALMASGLRPQAIMIARKEYKLNMGEAKNLVDELGNSSSFRKT